MTLKRSKVGLWVGEAKRNRLDRFVAVRCFLPGIDMGGASLWRRMGSFADAQAGLCLLSPKSSHTWSIRGRIFFRNLPIPDFVS